MSRRAGLHSAVELCGMAIGHALALDGTSDPPVARYAGSRKIVPS
jgi:hypothetical protein